MESMWTSCGLHVESMWIPCGISPCGMSMDSISLLHTPTLPSGTLGISTTLSAHPKNPNCYPNEPGSLAYSLVYSVFWVVGLVPYTRSLLSPHIPQGIHMESISFQVDSTHSTWNMFWVISQPFW